MEMLRARGELAALGGIILPVDSAEIVRHLPHCDAPLYGTDLRAEVAPDARFVDDLDHRPAVATGVAPDRLMRPVLARRPAQLAVDALRLIDLGDEMIVEIEVFPLDDVGERTAAHVRERPMPPLVHPRLESVHQILDDPEAVVHHGGAHLEA